MRIQRSGFESGWMLSNGMRRYIMKTSTLVGITMTMLLLALPAAASDHTLGIFGNANEDDTINMQDVTQIELVILGTMLDRHWKMRTYRG